MSNDWSVDVRDLAHAELRKNAVAITILLKSARWALDFYEWEDEYIEELSHKRIDYNLLRAFAKIVRALVAKKLERERG